MTTVEFSKQFDILYNNIDSNNSVGVNEYEKSVFLTKAEYEIINNYFNAKLNKPNEGIDDSPKRQIDLSNLITISTPVETTVASFYKGVTYTLPDNIMFILNETVVADNRTLSVIPVSYMDYSKVLDKPFKYPIKNEAWRLLSNSSSLTSEIIGPPNIALSNYTLRYIRRPKPIILTTLGINDYIGLSIDGITAITECELSTSLHREILQRAVELAKSAYQGDLNSAVQLGERSE